MGIKIGVEADVGDLNAALKSAQKEADALQSSLAGGHLSVETGEFESRMKSARQSADAFKKLIEDKKKLGIDTGDAEKQLANVRNAISESVRELTNGGMGKSKAETSMERLASKTKLATAEIKKQQEALRAMGRSYSESQVDAISRAHSRMRSGGGASAAYVQNGSFADILGDKSGSAVEQNARKTALNRILQNAGVEGRTKSPWSGKGGMMAGAFGGAVGAMMAGGTGGGVVGSLGSMVGMGIGALGGPLGMVAGGALGSAFGGAVGNSLGGAETESSGVADLRRSLGGIRVDFESLRMATRAASQGMGLTYAESLKLSHEFTQISGAMGGRGLTGDINNSSGFARSLGLDPSQGVSFMANMRQFKADGGDTKRMSMVMAEAIERGGLGAKAGELLSAVSQFASITARQSLVAAPNIAGYAGMMSSMNASGMPGMNVQSAAALMGKADSAFRGSGNEATDNFKLAAFQRAFGGGTSALDMGLIQSQGLFGSAQNAMQQILDDPNATASRKRRASKIASGPNGNRANIDIMMNQLRSYSKRGSDDYELSGATAFGVSQQEFRALDSAWQGYNGNGGISKALSDRGIDPSKVSSSKHMTLATILGSGGAALGDEATRFMKGDFGSLSSAESDSLQKKYAGRNEKGGEEALRTELLTLASQKELVDVGTATRDNIKQVENAVTSMSSGLTTATNAVRDAVLWASGKSPDDFKKYQKEQERKSIDDDYRNEIIKITGGRLANGPGRNLGNELWNRDPSKLDLERWDLKPGEVEAARSAKAAYQEKLRVFNGGAANDIHPITHPGSAVGSAYNATHPVVGSSAGLAPVGVVKLEVEHKYPDGTKRSTHHTVPLHKGGPVPAGTVVR